MSKMWVAVFSALIALMSFSTLAEANSGDFAGGVAIGTSYVGGSTAPTNGLIVQGNVGIGTTLPSSALQVNGTVTGVGSNWGGTVVINGGTGGSWFNVSGNSTSAYINSFTDTQSGSGSGGMIAFSRGSSVVGSIYTTSSTTSYNTTSDGRLKENVGSLMNGGSVLDQVTPVNYDWKYIAGNPKGVGFIAQDLYKFIPEAVTVGDSGTVDEKGHVTQQWALDMSKIMPYAVSAIRDLRIRLAADEKTISNQAKSIDELRHDFEAYKSTHP